MSDLNEGSPVVPVGSDGLPSPYLPDRSDHDDYGIAVCRKQLGVDSESALKAYVNLSDHDRTELVVAGKSGDVFRCREILLEVQLPKEQELVEDV